VFSQFYVPNGFSQFYVPNGFSQVYVPNGFNCVCVERVLLGFTRFDKVVFSQVCVANPTPSNNPPPAKLGS